MSLPLNNEAMATFILQLFGTLKSAFLFRERRKEVQSGGRGGTRTPDLMCVIHAL